MAMYKTKKSRIPARSPRPRPHNPFAECYIIAWTVDVVPYIVGTLEKNEA